MDSNRRAKLLKATVCSPENPCGKFYSYLGLFSHNPNGFYPLPPPPASFSASGDFVKTENAQYNSILTFSGNGTFSVYSRPIGFYYIIVGGGGGGGGGAWYGGGGGAGGGGQTISGSYTLLPGTHQIVVGAGGVGGQGGVYTNPVSDNNPTGATNGTDGQMSAIVDQIAANGGAGGNHGSWQIGGNGGASTGTTGSAGGAGGTYTPGSIGLIGGGGGGGSYFESGAAGGLNNSVVFYDDSVSTAYGAGGGGGRGGEGIEGGEGGGGGSSSGSGQGGSVFEVVRTGVLGKMGRMGMVAELEVVVDRRTVWTMLGLLVVLGASEVRELLSCFSTSSFRKGGAKSGEKLRKIFETKKIEFLFNISS